MVSQRSKGGKGAIPQPAAPGPAARSGDSGTVNRVLRLLGCFAEQERWGLNDLARALNLPKATAHRLLGLRDRRSVVQGTSVSVRGDLGGRQTSTDKTSVNCQIIQTKS